MRVIIGKAVTTIGFIILFGLAGTDEMLGGTKDDGDFWWLVLLGFIVMAAGLAITFIPRRTRHCTQNRRIVKTISSSR